MANKIVTLHTCKFSSHKLKCVHNHFEEDPFTKKKLQNMIMVSLLIPSEKGLRHLSNQCANKLTGVSQIQTQVNAESASEVKVTNINFEEINAITRSANSYGRSINMTS